MKKILIGIAVLILLGGILLGYAAMNANTLISYLKPELERSLSKAFKTDVQVGNVEVSIFPQTTFVIDRLAIGNGNNGGGLSFSDITLSVKLLPILSKQIEIVKLKLQKPEVTVVATPLGYKIQGLPEAGKKPREQGDGPTREKDQKDGTKEASNLKIALKSLEIDEGRVWFLKEETGERSSFERINLNTSVEILGMNVSLPALKVQGTALGDGNVELNAKGTLFDRATGNLTLGDNTVIIQGNTVNYSGQIRTAEKSGDVKLSSSGLDLASLTPIISKFVPNFEEYALQGSVSPELDLSFGSSGAIRANGTLGLSSVGASLPSMLLRSASGTIDIKMVGNSQHISSKDLKAELNGQLVTVSKDLVLVGKQLTINTLTVALLGGSADLPGEISLADDKKFAFKVVINRLPIDGALSIVKPGTPASITGTIDHVKGNVGGRGSGNIPASLSGRLDIALSNGSLKGGNIGGVVLKALNNVPFLMGSMTSSGAPAGMDASDTAFKTLTGTLHIANGMITTNDLTIVSPLYTVHCRGQIGTDTSVNLDADIVFEKGFTTSLIAKVKEAAHVLDADGNLVVPLKLTGTVAKLTILPNVESILKKGAKNALKDHAGKILDKALGKGAGEGAAKAIGDLLGL